VFVFGRHTCTYPHSHTRPCAPSILRCSFTHGITFSPSCMLAHHACMLASPPWAHAHRSHGSTPVGPCCGANCCGMTAPMASGDFQWLTGAPVPRRETGNFPAQGSAEKCWEVLGRPKTKPRRPLSEDVNGAVQTSRTATPMPPCCAVWLASAGSFEFAQAWTQVDPGSIGPSIGQRAVTGSPGSGRCPARARNLLAASFL
jgi:hypothetical protein